MPCPRVAGVVVGVRACGGLAFPGRGLVPGGGLAGDLGRASRALAGAAAGCGGLAGLRWPAGAGLPLAGRVLSNRCLFDRFREASTMGGGGLGERISHPSPVAAILPRRWLPGGARAVRYAGAGLVPAMPGAGTGAPVRRCPRPRAGAGAYGGLALPDLTDTGRGKGQAAHSGAGDAPPARLRLADPVCFMGPSSKPVRGSPPAPGRNQPGSPRMPMRGVFGCC